MKKAKKRWPLMPGLTTKDGVPITVLRIKVSNWKEFKRTVSRLIDGGYKEDGGGRGYAVLVRGRGWFSQGEYVAVMRPVRT